MSGTVSFSGLATTMDTKTIVTQLMALERRPENLLTKQKTTLQSQIDVFTQLNTALKSLKTVTAGMNTVTSFAGKSATVADSTIMTAQATGSAVTGTHTVVVNQLSSSQRQVSASGFASSSDTNFNTGTFTISDDKGGTPITLTIDEGNNSLDGIARAINAAGGMFSATVINDGTVGTPYRLMINGLDTKNYSLDFSGMSTPPITPNGAPYVNPTFPQSGATYVAGSDASFILDGISMTRSSNTVGDALPGVTLNLVKGGGATTSFTVSNDTKAVTDKINGFISSYNSALEIIHKQSVYDPVKHAAGVLSGDSMIMNLQASLQRMLSSPVTGATGPFSIASQIGIKTQTDGSLLLDTAKLTSALDTNFNGVVDLFTHNSNTSGLTSDQYGIAEQFNQKLTEITKPFISASYASNGVIDSRIHSIRVHMTSIDTQVARMEILMAQKEASLNRQFTAMETLVSSLQTQGSQLTSVLNAMTKSN